MTGRARVQLVLVYLIALHSSALLSSALEYQSKATPTSPLELVYAWGKTEFFQKEIEYIPQALHSGERYVIAAIGSAIAVFQTEEGRFFVAGAGDEGQLGRGRVSDRQEEPQPLSELRNRGIRAMSVGLSHIVASLGTFSSFFLSKYVVIISLLFVLLLFFHFCFSVFILSSILFFFPFFSLPFLYLH